MFCIGQHAPPGHINSNVRSDHFCFSVCINFCLNHFIILFQQHCSGLHWNTALVYVKPHNHAVALAP